MRNFIAEFKSKVKQIDKTETNIPEKMTVSNESIFSVYVRSNKGHNKPVLLYLPEEEAIFWACLFNKREKEYRDKLSVIPEEVYFYDYIKINTEEENIYWNPSEILIKEKL